jgi:hypothetical protein
VHGVLGAYIHLLFTVSTVSITASERARTHVYSCFILFEMKGVLVYYSVAEKLLQNRAAAGAHQQCTNAFICWALKRIQFE